MRPAALLFAFACLALLSALAWVIGVATADRIERTTHMQASATLKAAGEDWSRLETDGLIVRLTGEAPGSAERLHALDILGRLIGAARIEDATSLGRQSEPEPPVFYLEFLRSGGDVSLTGKIPADPGPGPIVAAVAALPGVTNVTDLMEISDGAAPDNWADTLSFSLHATELVRQGQVVVRADVFSVTTVADSAPQKQALEASLREHAPPGISLALDISAPPPVIAPFVFALSLMPDPRLTACAASTPEGRERILSAARRAGATGPLECRIGLGAPSLLWPRAVDLGVAALEQMRGGALQVLDTELTITAPEGLGSDEFEALSDDLKRALPLPFSLRTVLPDPPESDSPDNAPAPPVFIAELSEDGAVHLTGPVQKKTSDQAIMTYAASLFGFGKVSGSLRADASLSEGWPGRLLTGLETLSLLRTGRIKISTDTIAVSGRGDSEHISQEIRDVLRLRLGNSDGITVNVRFDPSLIPPEKPDLHPAQCEIRIATLLETGQITFAPNAIEIEADSLPIIDAIAGILRQCPQTRFEIGGHTDSQGREVLNMGLSQSRADAVLDALLAREVLIAELTARGYGESQPITTNQTEEGRQKNRRIAFKLLGTIDEPD